MSFNFMVYYLYYCPCIMSQKKAYIVAVDMGYGHQRAVHPLFDISRAPKGWDHDSAMIICANKYPGIPEIDFKRWNGSQGVYELISRMKRLPIVGDWIFGAMDYFQRIEVFYPKRDLSKPTIQLSQIYNMIKKGWGRHLIDELNRDPLPLITSFFIPAFFAEEHGYKGEIYCLCTDTDVSRAWAPLHPQKSRITYLAPNKRVRERLKLYGVRPEKIFITGFPLPKENIGSPDTVKTLKTSLGCRIGNLDPHGRYQKKYQQMLQFYLGSPFCDLRAKHPFTITFAVGGAGAQREVGIEILQSLRTHIDAGAVRLNLVAGSRADVFSFYEAEIKRLGLDHRHDQTVRIIYDEDKFRYFQKFDEALLTTDVLWTKPSELSFYAGLGLPIIIAPTIGSQEEYNKAWLHAIGAGFEQNDSRYTHEWLFDWLESGWLAEAAMSGFLHAPRNGAYHIADIVLNGKKSEIEDVHLL